MIEPDSDKIRAVAWLEIFPWLRIVRAFRIAISARALICGALGILLTVLGWAFIGEVFGTDSGSTKWLEKYIAAPWHSVTDDVIPDRPGDNIGDSFNNPGYMPGIAPDQNLREGNPLLTCWTLLTQPAVEGVSYKAQPPRAVAAILLCGLWGTLVWSFFGCIICRTAAMQLTVEEKVGLGSVLGFAFKKWPAYFFSPMMPLGAVFLLTAIVACLGFICAAKILVFFGGLVWPLALLAGFVMALLLLGVLFGWPLMWGAISTEGSDSFDAVSRSYSYLYQRPLHYLFYAIVAGIIGWLGWLFVSMFASGVVWITYWAAEWGAGWDGGIIKYGQGGGLSDAGVAMIGFWTGCVKLLAVGFLFSYFWSASTAIYLLLRRNVDATDVSEVYLDTDEEPAELPSIVKDSMGAPVAEEPEEQNS